jgi:hypothetical protein
MKEPLIKFLSVSGIPFRHKKASDEMKYSHYLPHFLNSFSSLLKEHFLSSDMTLKDIEDIGEDPKITKERDDLVDEDI